MSELRLSTQGSTVSERPLTRASQRARATVRAFVLALFVLAALFLGLMWPVSSRWEDLLAARWQAPWILLLLLALPPLLWLETLGRDARVPRLRVGTVAPLVSGPLGLRAWVRDLPGALRTVAAGLLLAALARPVALVTPAESVEEGIDIIVVLDLSGSMRAVFENMPPDLQRFVPAPAHPAIKPTRLDGAKAVLRDFISRRKTDRMGMVVFAKQAFVLSPPTLDYRLLDLFVSNVSLEVIDPDGTAIGDGLGVAAARLRRSQAKSKAVLLLTDGDNNGGKLEPEHSAELLKKVGARLYTIQVGEGDDARVQEGFFFGQPRYVRMSFPTNPALLKKLAATTGGAAYVASDAKQLQASVHDVLDKLERSKLEATVASTEELYRFFLLPGVLLLAADLLVRAFVLRRFP